MTNVVEGVVKYYDISEQTYKGGTRLHKLTLNVGGAEVRSSAFVQGTSPVQGAKPGDTVKTVVEENDKGYKNFDQKKFKVLERGNSQVGNGGGGSSATTTNKDSSIARQNAVHGASRIVAALAHSGVYSSSDEAASDLVRIAEEYIMPYGLEGIIKGPADVSEGPVNDVEPEGVDFSQEEEVDDEFVF